MQRKELLEEIQRLSVSEAFRSEGQLESLMNAVLHRLLFEQLRLSDSALNVRQSQQ